MLLDHVEVVLGFQQVSIIIVYLFSRTVSLHAQAKDEKAEEKKDDEGGLLVRESPTCTWTLSFASIDRLS